MKSDAIIAEITAKIKSNLHAHAEKLDASLTAENAEIVTKIIKTAVMEAAAAGFKIYIQENETTENTVVHHGRKYQFNRKCSKVFSTIFGKSNIERRLYQNENGRPRVVLIRRLRTKTQLSAPSRFTATCQKTRWLRFVCKVAIVRECPKRNRRR